MTEPYIFPRIIALTIVLTGTTIRYGKHQDPLTKTSISLVSIFISYASVSLIFLSSISFPSDAPIFAQILIFYTSSKIQPWIAIWTYLKKL